MLSSAFEQPKRQSTSRAGAFHRCCPALVSEPCWSALTAACIADSSPSLSEVSRDAAAVPSPLVRTAAPDVAAELTCWAVSLTLPWAWRVRQAKTGLWVRAGFPPELGTAGCRVGEGASAWEGRRQLGGDGGWFCSCGPCYAWHRSEEQAPLARRRAVTVPECTNPQAAGLSHSAGVTRGAVTAAFQTAPWCPRDCGRSLVAGEGGFGFVLAVRQLYQTLWPTLGILPHLPLPKPCRDLCSEIQIRADLA